MNDSAPALREIFPAMSTDVPEQVDDLPWRGATWVAGVDLTRLDGAADWLPLRGSRGYNRAQVLIREGMRVRGFVVLPIYASQTDDGWIETAELSRAAAGLPHGDEVPSPATSPSITVIICTRDRVDSLASALASVRDLDYEDYDIVVVDNASPTPATADYVRSLGDPRIRLVSEPVPGLSRARNTGLRAARGEIVAYTDDDVVVDRLWLRGLVAGFDRGDVECVSGLVPTGELRTRTQMWFDRRVSWSDATSVRMFRLDEPPADNPLFPFRVGDFGTGASFAVRRETLQRLGGFDEALGVGTPTGGGEDIDMFVRILLDGGGLVVEPSAVVWHRHRDDIPALRKQAVGYGLGLGAWLTKVALQPRTAWMLARRVPGGIRRAARMARGEAAPEREGRAISDADLPAEYTQDLGALEVRSALRGPWRLVRSRMMGGRPAPLRMDAEPAGHESLPLSGGLGRTGRAAWLRVAALVAAACGLLGQIAALPSDLRLAGIVVFLLVGPGAVIAARLALPTSTAAVVTMTVGLSLLTGVGYLMLVLGSWYPGTVTWVLLAITVVGGVQGLRPGVLRSSWPRWLKIAHGRRLRVGDRLGLLGPVVVTVGGLLVWVVSLLTADGTPTSNFGLLFQVPGLIVATVLVLLGFVLLLMQDRLVGAAGALLALIAVTRASVPLLSPLPIYTWAYKHMGVVDWILQTGTLAPDVDIYNMWPGMFAGSAWLMSVSGAGQLGFAHWFAVGIHIGLATAVYDLARAFGRTRRVALMAVLVVETLNWVGQDYYAPQSVAYLMAVGLIGLLLRTKTMPRLGWLIVPSFVALTVTHQLTPIWVAGIALVLGVTRRVRPWWLGIVLALVAGSFVAANSSIVADYGFVSGFSPLTNAQSNIPTVGSAGRQFTMFVDRLPPLVLWAGAAVLAVNRWLTGRPVWVPLILGFSSFGLLLGQSYGGEAIFRVFLYSLPGCALLVSGWLVNGLARLPVRGVQAKAHGILTSVLVIVMSLCSLQGYLGTWPASYVSTEQFAHAKSLYARIDPPALILGMATGLPDRPVAEYVAFARAYANYDLPLVPNLEVSTLAFTSQADVAVLEAAIGQQGIPTYVVVSRQMVVVSDYYGLYPDGGLERLPALLQENPRWTLVIHDEDLWVFRATVQKGES
ncbi:glycosyltransferase [Propionicicella superfundia]|uniref:glycosyltransferase n=1 Tax=Propionicicella superfundia TaxID=348582 RepID=UPI0004106E2B|nr:glycosyltransferase [Propionicicella superfundia]